MPKIVKSKSYKTVKTAMQEWVTCAAKLEDTASAKYKSIRKCISKNHNKLTVEQKEQLSHLIGKLKYLIYLKVIIRRKSCS